MTRLRRSLSLVLAALCAPALGVASPRPHPHAVPAPEAGAASPDAVAYATELNVDGYQPAGPIATLVSGSSPTVKAAFGNRFTLRNDQSPFELEAVQTFAPNLENNGGGFVVGDPIRITVFVDASRSGQITNATPVSDATYAVSAVNTLSTYVLAQPIVVRQGDVYVVVTDLTTDSESTPIPALIVSQGGSSDPRSILSSTYTAPPNPLITTGYSLYTNANAPGNFVVRALGDPAPAGAAVTGGGGPGSPNSPTPTNFSAAGASTVTLRWTPPTISPPSGNPVAEAEPNDAPASPQTVALNTIVSGAAQPTDAGAPGGFDDAIEDWYRVTLVSSGTLTIDLVDSGQYDFDLFLYPQAGPFEPGSAVAYSAGDVGTHEFIARDMLPAGTYLVGVSAFANPAAPFPSPQPYSLRITPGPFLNRYDVYRGDTPTFTADASTFVGTAPADASSFVVTESPSGSYYRITSVVDGFRSQPTAAVAVPATPGFDTVGVSYAATSTWFLRNANSPGVGDAAFQYGGSGALVPIAGDWDGDGSASAGLYDPATGAFFLKNTNAPGAADLLFVFGAGGAGYVPIAGDWDGDGKDTVGLYDPATGTFFLRDANAPGVANFTFGFGAGGAGYVPIAGDWNGDGVDTIGLYAPATGAFFLRNTNTPGVADVTFVYGAAGAGYVPVVGDWDGDNVDGVGLYQPASGVFFLKNVAASGGADFLFAFGGPNGRPVAGNWDSL